MEWRRVIIERLVVTFDYLGYIIAYIKEKKKSLTIAST
jgi:hypothetical protein